MSQSQDNNWLLVSDEGFAEQNAGRPKGHLVKELFQNSLDAFGDKPGVVRLDFAMREQSLLVYCEDNGEGVSSMEDLRTVFWTSKHDSVTKRGRMGRGFKELLCLATTADVSSRCGTIHFTRTGNKRGILRKPNSKFDGTRVQMFMPWGKGEIEGLVAYFHTFLVPPIIEAYVCGEPIIYRQPRHYVECTVNTELYENAAWVRRRRQTVIHLVPVQHDEEPTLYEMGIPVCSAEWTAPFHIDCQQRVPMNPNRDAVASGFIPRLHGELIGTIFRELDGATLKEEWVGSAAKFLSAEDKRALVDRAFGNNVVRSVPAMSSQQRQYDAEAAASGAQIVNTRHLSGGFREVFQEVVPTTKQLVERVEQERRHVAASAGVPLSQFAESGGEDSHTRRQQWVDACGGQDRINEVLHFLQVFGNRLAEEYMEEGEVLISDTYVAELDNDVVLFSTNGTLTVTLNSTIFWTDPTSEESIRLFFEAIVNEITRRSNHNGGVVHARITSKAISMLLHQSGDLQDQLATLAR